jgi:hypothetical protein
MEPARTYSAQPSGQTTLKGEAERARRQDKETMIGKSIFYSTVAIALWFFYWLAGINCPC